MKLKFWLLSLCLGFLLMGCFEQNEKSIQSTNMAESYTVKDTIVLKSAITYNHKISLWTLNDVPFSGFAVSYYSDGTLKEKFGVLNGKKQQEFRQWFPDGHVKMTSNYHIGKLHGEKKIWSADSTHVLIAQFNYHTGKAHGEQKKWYATGQLYKKLNLNKGKEEGIQKAFRKNGALYANYEARQGRIFGLKKAALCYGLEDENVNYKK